MSLSEGYVVTTRKSKCGHPFDTYTVDLFDHNHGNLLREQVKLTIDDAVIAEETHRYDEKNHLRTTTWLDGTSMTNAYSCCRLLWSRDREGRTILRSAKTGEDHLYHAYEDVWLARTPRMVLIACASISTMRSDARSRRPFRHQTIPGRQPIPPL